jgi:hypothetical protein
VPTYMLQWFQPRLEEDAFVRLSQRLTHAAASLSEEGTPIRHLASAVSGPDEMAFCVLEAPSAEAASEVSRRAGLLIERITDAHFTGGGRTSPRRHGSLGHQQHHLGGPTG